MKIVESLREPVNRARGALYTTLRLASKRKKRYIQTI